MSKRRKMSDISKDIAANNASKPTQAQKDKLFDTLEECGLTERLRKCEQVEALPVMTEYEGQKLKDKARTMWLDYGEKAPGGIAQIWMDVCLEWLRDNAKGEQ